MVEVIRAFCWHQKFVPKWFSALARGLYTCIKSLKIKISKRSFWNLQHTGKEKRPFCCHQNFVPSGLFAPTQGYIHMVKHEKIYIKSDFKAFFFICNKWAVMRAFCWHQKFVPRGLSAIAPGLYTYIKLKVFKIILQRERFKTCHKWAKWSGLSVDINICPQGVVCLCPGAMYMYKSIKICTRTRCPVNIYRTTGPLVI